MIKDGKIQRKTQSSRVNWIKRRQGMLVCQLVRSER